MYILFIADFDENGSDVVKLNSLSDVIVYLGWEENEDLVSELLSNGVVEGEWHHYHLEIV